MVSVSLRPTAPSSDVVIRAIRASDALDEDTVPFSALGFRQEAGQTLVTSSPAGTKAPVTVFVAVDDEASDEDLRRAVAAGLRAAPPARHAVVEFGALEPHQLTAVAEGAVLTAYRFDRYQGTKAREKAAQKPQLSEVSIIASDARKSEAKTAVERGVTIAEAVCQARDWVNTPSGDLRPADFAAQMEAGAAKGVTVTVWDEKRLAKERCGGILSVGRGSEAPPRLVTLTYSPSKATKHLALVGKGITFDSGGLSLKPGASMQTMKCDMGGAAAIVAAVNAIAALGLPIRVTAYACLAENMPSGSATRPGDVITMRNGKTVEVLNTDAEGRMVMGDGLSLATEAEPDHIIDVATLTGAAMTALGQRTAAILGSDEYFEERVFAASREAGEDMWRLPITDEVVSALKSSHIADLRQISSKPYGGTLFAAAFLREFTGDISWAHLDIAGPAFNDGGAYDYTPNGGTGAGVRTLVQIASTLA
ncbi:leucyl aminopeptidase [Aeromicrobium camelliae]|uniref:Probable cytosol aminopeptidase n=1 Tax=Aeromicrobium camelliae TaxID=1538144 RepID=A0A3N6W6J3_9ACTN|nr:leucyl aminopeptidase [Aeromicrobium camelliae]RQN03130.1 leucyl aminopeptidase [Aeromicrobium camelliae]